MARLRAIFFDAAGTLFDAREPVGRTYARIAREFGLDATDDEVTRGFRRAFGQAPELAFGPGRPPAELRLREREWWRDVVAKSFEGLGEFRDFDGFFETLFGYFAEPSHWRVLPEVLPELGRLKECGFELGVISNFDFRLYEILENLHLKPFFNSITISSEAGYAKPRREVFVAALTRHGADAAEAMHVGDSPHLDVAGAHAAGMAAVLVDPEARDSHSIEGRKATIRSLAYLKEVTQVLGSA